MKKKQTGFALLFVMLVISFLTLIITSISLKVYTTKRLTSTLNQQGNLVHTKKSCIELISGFINGYIEIKSEQSKSIDQDYKQPDSSQKQENDKSTQETNNKKSEQQKKIALHLNKILYTNLEFDISNICNVGTKLKVYITCEDGKLPASELIKLIFEEKKNKKKNQKSPPQDNSSDTIPTTSNNEKTSSENKNEETQVAKTIEELLKNLSEKGSAFKKNENNKESDSIKILKKIIINYANKLKDIFIYPESNLYEQDQCQSIDQQEYTNTFSLNDAVTFLPISQVNMLYAAPALLEALGYPKVEKIYNDKYKEKKEKFIQGSDKDNILSSLFKIYEDLFGKPDKEIKSDLLKKLMTIELVPTSLKAYIIIEENNIPIEKYTANFESVDSIFYVSEISK